MTIPHDLAGQVAELYREVAELKRRARNRKRTGEVVQLDLQKGLARVKLAEPGGTPYLTGWLPWKEIASGGIKAHIPPTVGEQVDVVSESGDGTDAVVEMSTPSTANPRPHDGPEAVIVKGATRLVIGDGTVAITADVTINGDLEVVGDSIKHNEIEIGSTHMHTDVEPGGALSGPPVGEE